ncbi:enoyl-CoA hydratase-related protein [Halioglobus japonicus]|uniref:enoyl-CoA hydratase-related protein n=1 Tax=Halioglobus japonicus TaxID=930805 RepID=UPI003B8A934A
MRAFNGCQKPIIGAVNGFAVTGGFEIALACDFLYAAESARFADTHARVGLIPGWGLSQKLPRLVGINRAREISFTGNYFGAADAEAWGLVNRVCSDNDLLAEALDTAHQIATALPEALFAIKAMMNEGWEDTLGHALVMEGERSNAYNSSIDVSGMAERLSTLKARPGSNAPRAAAGIAGRGHDFSKTVLRTQPVEPGQIEEMTGHAPRDRTVDFYEGRQGLTGERIHQRV